MTLAAGLGSCGGSGSAKPLNGSSVSAGLHGGSLELANCSDWNGGSDLARRRTILALRGFYGGAVGPGNKNGPQVRGPVLDNQRAYDLFRHYCAQSFAAGFNLYKLYGRAAGFAGAAP